MKMNKQTATLTTRGVRAKRRKISFWKKFQSKFNAEEWKDLCVQELEEGRKTSCSTRKIEKATLLLRNNSSALEFERLGGRGNARKWRQSIRIHSGYPIEELEADELKRGVPIGKWLRDEGGTWRANVVGRPAEIWSDGSQAYKFCEFVGYKADSWRTRNSLRRWHSPVVVHV